MGNKAVKTPIGMISSYFFPFASEPANGHPVYGARVDMGAAVTGVETIRTSVVNIEGDDQVLMPIEVFVSGQMDTETTLDDLAVNSLLFGHRYEAGRESAGADDIAPFGAYAFIQHFVTKKGHIYRPTFYYKTSAIQSSEKIQARTKGQSLKPMMHAVSLNIMRDNAKSWREREDYATEAEAEVMISALAGDGNAYSVRIQHSGAGASTPGVGTKYVAAGGSQVIDFGTSDPDALYDNGVDVTSSITGHKYTISSIAANHDIVAIWE